MKHEYETEGVCPSMIFFELDGNIIRKVSFRGGCDGNLKAISRIIEGMTVEEIEEKFKGIQCDERDTSCSDQLAVAVRKAYEEEKRELSLQGNRLRKEMD